MNARRVLLVEDNPQDEKLTLRALQNLNIGNQIDVARDGAEALDYLFRRGVYARIANQPLPGVVLLDIKLPRLSGIEVLEQLRADASTRAMPVIMLTSSDEGRDIDESYRKGANSYVRKPVDAGEFAQAVSQIGRYWLRLNELPKG